ncbi:hypothetical protein [Flagellimonas onchidii]|uniref:hypothetical protein n=1 Tax=Flagellimonas onchidii TaxID=2562684 RepID=UPI0010A6B11B|nr:hypothetical protein [Allomuricauda onchidii]
MASSISRGRKDGCKDSIGGLQKLYLAQFTPYRRNAFGFNGNVITSIPTTFVHLFELTGNNTFSQSRNGDGYDQTLTVEFRKLDVQTTLQMMTLNYIELRALVQDRNGNWFILGLENGLESEGLTIETGDSRSSFNGYRMTLKGKETLSVPFVSDPFTNGFIDVSDPTTEYYQFQDYQAVQFQDGEFFLFN